MKPERSNTYCHYPFKEVTVKTWRDGKLEFSWPCCHMGNSKQGYTEFKIDGIGDLTPEEIFNSSRMELLRQRALNGERDPACETCWDAEDRYLDSPRLMSDHPEYEEFEEGQISLDVTATNECNLACRMCTPTSSHKLMKDYKFFKDHKLDYEVIDNVERFSQSRPLMAVDTSQWKWIEQNTHKIGLLKASGGEPFYDSKMIRLLERFVKEDTAKNCSIAFHTNGTQYSEEVCGYLKKFKSVNNSNSIDGVGKVYEFIRHGQKFEDLEESMKRYSELPNKRFTAATLILSAHNILNVSDWIEWLYTVDEQSTFVISEVYPRTRGIHILHLPVHILQLAKSKWIRTLAIMNSKTTYFDESSLLNAIKILDWAIENNQEDPVKLLKETKLFDMSRGQSYKDYLDEVLVEYLSMYEKELDKIIYKA